MSIETEVTIIEVSIVFLCLALLFHVAAWRLHERNRDKEGVPVWLKYDEQELARQVGEVLAKRWEAQMLAREKLDEFLSGYDENDTETESEAKE